MKFELYDSERFLNTIRDYRKMDLKNTEFTDVVKKFQSVMTLFHHICANIGGIPIFRVRKIEKGKSHTRKADLWCPPSNSIDKMGRLNNVNESIFYAAFDPVTAIKEKRFKKGDKFSLVIYNVKPTSDNVLSTINIGIPAPMLDRPEKERICTMILNDFLFSEFTRHVGTGTEYQYKATCAIGKILLDMPNKDSIIYPSMVDYSKKNLAIVESAAKKRLELKEVLKCELLDYDSEFNPILKMSKKGIYNKELDNITYSITPNRQRKFTLKVDTFFKGYNPYNDLAAKLDRY